MRICGIHLANKPEKLNASLILLEPSVMYADLGGLGEYAENGESMRTGSFEVRQVVDNPTLGQPVDPLGNSPRPDTRGGSRFSSDWSPVAWSLVDWTPGDVLAGEGAQISDFPES